ncbi:hypothetical protein [Treponema primitia]|uniref:hypothetical protein n=1 Tax=Treponema primitia TaxID=88058 RepID=UPI000255516E|nr:hypothetical protein [Treponema primitia]
MLKGLYFMGWYRDMWNYHPSLPQKNMQMVDDISDIHANMLIWSSLGSGAIGLPYMEKEAFGDTSPRMRLYGFMNDSEFCHECAKRGVKVFSVLWKAQLWEFGAEFNEDESKLLSLNILRGASKNHKYVGMSELSTNKYPKLFDPIEKFFPNGLLDWQGKKVGDFLQEFKSTSLEGRNILSAWLMAPNHDHKCYSPCCNKESYLTYMKRDVELMIDAGAGGLHIDEYDTQKHILSNAGCFCPECLDKFRRYLKKNNIALPADAGSLDAFDYRKYLLGKGYTDENLLAFNGNDRWDIPLYRHFFNMQMDSIEWVVRELSTHAKAYGKKARGENFPVTANLFQCMPIAWSSKKHLDLLAGEKTAITLRQDGWYKFAFGWLNGKECCFVEDPNQYVRDMLVDIKNGINDRFIMFALEPIAHGFHVAFPYGSWLQNQVRDAFWPDLRLLKNLGPWLDTNEHLFTKNPVADIAVIYDHNSAYENMVSEPATDVNSTYNKVEKISLKGVEELGRQGAFSNQGDFGNFFNLVQDLSDAQVLYNVIYESPDEILTVERLKGYKKVVVPDAFLLDETSAAALNAFAAAGGAVITYARATAALSKYTNYKQADRAVLVGELAKNKGLVEAADSKKFGIALHKTKTGYSLHILNYSFNEQTHLIDPIAEAAFKLNFSAKSAKVYSFPENSGAVSSLEGNSLKVKNAGIYTVIEIN